MKHFLSISFLLFLTTSIGQNPEGFEALCRDTLAGTIPTIRISEFVSQRSENPDTFVLDAREKAEYKVSHIDGAINIGNEKFNLNALNGIPKNAPIVIYCSIGYRSEKIGEQLQDAGYINVHNLFGGIFSWYNNGLPVYDSKGNATNQIHGYDKEWSQWLTKDRGKIILK